jgi:hypothetical protein
MNSSIDWHWRLRARDDRRLAVRVRSSVRRSDFAGLEEIERRAAEIEAGTAETITLDEYRAHVRARRAARPQR